MSDNGQREDIQNFKKSLRKIRERIEQGDHELAARIYKLAERRPLTEKEEFSPKERSEKVLEKSPS
ncbi:MAG: hypothetical protein P1V20_21155 [Verrucomicrobiales bacterium]|nr:hypothetical protein [Verrucomicrobiales bacterium]